MNFLSRVKTGFQLQKNSFFLLLKHPQLLLYWLIPSCFVVLALANSTMRMKLLKSLEHLILTLHLQEHLYVIAVAVFQIPTLILASAFIVHVHNLLNHQPTSARKTAGHIIPLLPWLIMLPFITEIFSILTNYITIYLVRSLESPEQFIQMASYIETGSYCIKLVWKLLLFYTLVNIVLEKDNTFKAVWRSIKSFFATWAEVTTGQVCILGLYHLLNFLFTGGLMFLPGLFNNTLIQAAVFPLLVASAILPLRTFQVLMYHSHTKNKERHYTNIRNSNESF